MCCLQLFVLIGRLWRPPKRSSCSVRTRVYGTTIGRRRPSRGNVIDDDANACTTSRDDGALLHSWSEDADGRQRRTRYRAPTAIS